MKILAFSDIHDSDSVLNKLKKKIDSEKPDILICAGDISLFEARIEKTIEKISKFGILTLMIHGNHESVELLKKLCELYENIVFLHNSMYRIGDYVFFGHGGGGFSKRSEEFEKISKMFKKDIRKDDIVTIITHAPIFNTELDRILEDHVGNDSYRKFIEKNKIVLAISGHIHENFNVKDKIKDTKLINPGPYGEIIEI